MLLLLSLGAWSTHHVPGHGGGPKSTTTTTTTIPPTTQPPTTAPPTTSPPTTQPPPPSSCAGVTVNPTDNANTVLSAHPAGTTFCFAPGTHRIATTLNPEAGDTLKGAAPGAIIDGAKVVSNWIPSGSTWVAPGFLPSSGSTHGSCTVPGCTYGQDVFRDGVPLVRAMSAAEVGPGEFYTDFAANRIVVGSDPNGHLMEQSVAGRLVASGAPNVTVTNLILQHSATSAQQGGVEPFGAGASGWDITYNEVRYVHGSGIGPGWCAAPCTMPGNTYIAHNKVHHNGFEGIGTNGAGNVVEFNEIYRNNQASYKDGAGPWYDTGWGGGGGKSGRNDHLTFRNNHSHHNQGPGHWCDINCGHVTVTDNYFNDNFGPGYFYEISYGEVVPGDGLRTTIANNVTVRNNNPPNGGGGIRVAASQDLDIFGNKSYDEASGIWTNQQNRPDTPDPRGVHEVKDIYVHDNVMNFHGTPPIFWHGKTGLHSADDVSFRAQLYTAAYNNRWRNNTYHAPSLTAEWFDWMPCPDCHHTWAEWQAFGQDLTGTIDTNNPSPPAPPTLVTGPLPLA